STNPPPCRGGRTPGRTDNGAPTKSTRWAHRWRTDETASDPTTATSTTRSTLLRLEGSPPPHRSEHRRPGTTCTACARQPLHGDRADARCGTEPPLGSCFDRNAPRPTIPGTRGSGPERRG